MYRYKWKRIPGDIDYCKGEEGLEAIFHFNVKSSTKPENHILFSYTYPYTFNDMIYSMKEVQDKASTNKLIYYDQQVLCESLEGRPMFEYTLTTKKALEEKKPVVYITCRVHCGESPGSYMLQGVVDKLLKFDQRQS